MMRNLRRSLTTIALMIVTTPVGAVFAHGGEEPVAVETGDPTVVIVAGVAIAVTAAAVAGAIAYAKIRSGRAKK